MVSTLSADEIAAIIEALEADRVAAEQQIATESERLRAGDEKAIRQADEAIRLARLIIERLALLIEDLNVKLAKARREQKHCVPDDPEV